MPRKFVLKTVKRNIMKSKAKSALSILISTLVVLLINLYIGNISSTQNQLTKLANTLTVNADVTNLNGSQITALRIKDETIRKLESSSHVKELKYSVELIGGLGAFELDDWRNHLKIRLTAVNDLSALPGMAVEDAAFINGVDADILHTSQAACLTTKDFSRKNNLTIGNTLQLTLYYYEYPSLGTGKLKINPLGLYDFTIVGIVEQINGSGIDALLPDIILPINWVRNAYAQEGVEFYPTKASFAVADPLMLNQFKSEVKSFMLLSVIPETDFSHNGSALSIDDKIFIQAANHLKGNLNLLSIFLPFIVVIVVFIGYITSYMLMQNRRKEFAVMRSLGTSKGLCYLIFIFENVALALTGSLFGSLIAMLLIADASAVVLISSACVFFVCFLLGTTVALYLLGRFSVMDVLSQID